METQDARRGHRAYDAAVRYDISTRPPGADVGSDPGIPECFGGLGWYGLVWAGLEIAQELDRDGSV